MFRESNYTEPHHHLTYSKKPVSLFQLQQQESKFNDYGGSSSQFVVKPGDSLNAPIPREVPCATDTIYDPSDPNADWSGLVPKQYHKRQITNNINQHIGLEHTENGIISTVYKEEYGRKRRTEIQANTSHVGDCWWYSTRFTMEIKLSKIYQS